MYGGFGHLKGTIPLLLNCDNAKLPKLCFTNADNGALIALLIDAVLLKDIEVLPSIHYGVKGGYKIDILIYYIDRVTKWEKLLPKETQDLIDPKNNIKKTSDFYNFPNIPTSNPKYGASFSIQTVNMLAALTSWSIKSSVIDGGIFELVEEILDTNSCHKINRFLPDVKSSGNNCYNPNIKQKLPSCADPFNNPECNTKCSSKKSSHLEWGICMIKCSLPDTNTKDYINYQDPYIYLNKKSSNLSPKLPPSPKVSIQYKCVDNNSLGCLPTTESISPGTTNIFLNKNDCMKNCQPTRKSNNIINIPFLKKINSPIFILSIFTLLISLTALIILLVKIFRK